MVSIPITELESHVGQVIGESPWTEISQERVNAFADATGDHQWIHVDVERARRESPGKVRWPMAFSPHPCFPC
ncbi:MaoC/PaaZ C-terminal domain-containing protein [Marinobacter koreensis]|uniref:MaoC/PaaZ C-terminal domain-containing protein n=1 Tax=Marinobacter koreensis TaxID=335974 RepID=UPI003614D2EE